MGKKRPDAHLYADGCVIQATNHYGVGWIATDRKDRRPSEKKLAPELFKGLLNNHRSLRRSLCALIVAPKLDRYSA